MGDVGAEVGLKMRSAIRAKLMELDCYIDDELPDYIMVMVANKRTKSQMREDLSLFLKSKTSTFVDWLHIVLKKLKEVHVTNPDVLKKANKRRAADVAENAKKMKKEKKLKKRKDKSPEPEKSLTDDLPIAVNKFTESRKILSTPNQRSDIMEDNFDIPLLSEVDNLSNEQELKMIEKRIKSVKNRLGIQVPSSDSSEEEDLPAKSNDKVENGRIQNYEDFDSDDDFINIKADPEELFPRQNEQDATSTSPSRNNSITSRDEVQTPPLPAAAENPVVEPEVDKSSTTLKNNHTRITFEKPDTSRKRSVMDRLGVRAQKSDVVVSRKQHADAAQWERSRRQEVRERNSSSKPVTSHRERRRDSPPDRHHSRESDRHRQNILSRLGVQSKVSVPIKPVKPPTLEEKHVSPEPLPSKDVPSSVKVKPRIVPANIKQASKALLVKAVAEAQRSVAQTPTVGENRHKDAAKDTDRHSRDKNDDVRMQEKEAIFTKGFKAKQRMEKHRKLMETTKMRLKNMIISINTQAGVSAGGDATGQGPEEYVPTPIAKQPTSSTFSPQPQIEYKPSPLQREPGSNSCSSGSTAVSQPEPSQAFKHQFIVTLDGIDKLAYDRKTAESQSIRGDAAAEPALQETRRKTPSPIVFEPADAPIVTQSAITVADLPKAQKIVVKRPQIREQCKFWPTCMAGKLCEFAHPPTPLPVILPASTANGLNICKLFPHCKFGDQCLYSHPQCKFATSCTRRDCPYSHTKKPHAPKPSTTRVPVVVPAELSSVLCKYHPTCSNAHCPFQHPRPCKFGKYCRNQHECTFTHAPIGTNRTWKSCQV